MTGFYIELTGSFGSSNMRCWHTAAVATVLGLSDGRRRR